MREMPDWLKLAFDDADAIHATAAIAHHRDQRTEAAGADARSYEVVVKPDETLLQVAERVMPKFALHMEALKLPRHGGPRMFFSVFVGERVYFLTAEETVALFDEVIGEDRVRRALLLPGPR